MTMPNLERDESLEVACGNLMIVNAYAQRLSKRRVNMGNVSPGHVGKIEMSRIGTVWPVAVPAWDSVVG